MSLVQLEGAHVLSCAKCRTHMALSEDVASKAFHGRTGRAFLVEQTVNVRLGPPEDRVLLTGLHTVADVLCRNCSAYVGWKYQAAFNPSQRYKVGKFILELSNLLEEQ
jgi:hypothetical protein